MNTNMMIYQKAQHSGDVRRIVATNQPKFCCVFNLLLAAQVRSK